MANGTRNKRYRKQSGNVQDEAALQDIHIPKMEKKIEVCFEVDVLLPNQPLPSQMINYGLPLPEQKWRRQETIPDKLYHKAIAYRANKDNAITEFELYEVCSIIEREHIRIREGVWAIIGGIPRYIPGSYYFYLQEWRMKDGRYPTFRESDRLFFVFFEYMLYEPNAKGILDMENRQTGKSSRFGCILYWGAIQCRDTRIGIQSKSEADAKAFFADCIVTPWRRLPFWFKPVHDGTDDPKKELIFKSPSEIMTKAKATSGVRIERLPELNTIIDFKHSEARAYDGLSMLFHFADEYGKTPNVDVVDRLQTVLQCTLKCLMASTIEDIGTDGKTLEQSNILWSQSNPNERNQNGYTTNGLYRMFKPASFCYEKMGVSFIDAFGDSKTEEAELYILNGRKPLEGVPRQLQKEIRLNPLSPDEALMPPDGATVLDAIKLTNQEIYLRELAITKKEKYVRGDFHWVNAPQHHFKQYHIPENGSYVEFIPNPNGRFMVVDLMDVENRNLVKYDNMVLKKNPVYSQPNYEFTPMNAITKGACDPFDYRVSKGKKGTSDGAGVILNTQTNTFICFYLGRPKIDIYLDDMAAMLYYYGAKSIIETNKSGLFEHLINIGMTNFISEKLNMGTKQTFTSKDVKELGEYTDKFVLEKISVALEKYVSYNCDKIFVQEAIKQLKVWTPENSNNLDIPVAMGLALLGSEYKTYKETAKPVLNIDYRSLLSL